MARRVKILQPYYVAREWGSTTAEDIQLNFERLFQVVGQRTAAVATVTATAADVGNHDDAPKAKLYFEGWAAGNFLQPVAISVGTVGAPITLQRTTPPFADAPYTDQGNPAVNSILANVLGINTLGFPDHEMLDQVYDYDASWIMRTDSRVENEGQLFVGVGKDLTVPGPLGPYVPTTAGCWFRYLKSPALPAPPPVREASDSFWTVMCHNGTDLSPITSTQIPCLPDTRYHLRIKKVGTLCSFFVNGQETQIATKVPVVSDPLTRLRTFQQNFQGTDRHFYLSRCWVSYGT